MDGMLIGRFQPFHLGHLEALRFALSKSDRLWLGIGSSTSPRQKSNPFSADERREMILSSIDDTMAGRIGIYPIPDVDNHKKWMELIDALMPKFDIVFTNDDHTKRMYSGRGTGVIPIPLVNRADLSGTNIRGLVARGQGWEHLVPDGTRRFLLNAGARQRLLDL